MWILHDRWTYVYKQTNPLPPWCKRRFDETAPLGFKDQCKFDG